AIDPDPGRGRRAGERRKITDTDRILGGDGGLGQRASKSSAGGCQRLTASQRHMDCLPKRSCFTPEICRSFSFGYFSRAGVYKRHEGPPSTRLLVLKREHGACAKRRGLVRLIDLRFRGILTAGSPRSPTAGAMMTLSHAAGRPGSRRRNASE